MKNTLWILLVFLIPGIAAAAGGQEYGQGQGAQAQESMGVVHGVRRGCILGGIVPCHTEGIDLPYCSMKVRYSNWLRLRVSSASPVDNVIRVARAKP